MAAFYRVVMFDPAGSARTSALRGFIAQRPVE